jgi:hypothetical protein
VQTAVSKLRAPFQHSVLLVIQAEAPGMDFGGIFISSWNDQWSPCGSGAKDPVIPREVSAGCGHQHGKFGDEILPLENDSAGSVS